MTDPKKISIADYTYDLPADRIALFPLEQRDASKLLVWKDGSIAESTFSNIAEYIPANSMVVFNNTKVINARLRFQKTTGSIIEIFCLEPAGRINEYSSVMNSKGSCRWKCFIGGISKWKDQYIERSIEKNNTLIILKAQVVEKISDAYIVEFSWEPADLSFAEILELTGDIPLPPYIKRASNSADSDRYQTIYAMHKGSVAAPTAGLHFTETIFESLSKKNISSEYLTLHVGAGTFKPVKSATMQDHEMHAEWIDVSTDTIRKLIQQEELIIAAGTTSLRTIETLYWLGVKLLIDPSAEIVQLGQWDVYGPALTGKIATKNEALQALLNWLDARKQDRIFTQTQLMIAPGYEFRIVKALITNFHQPQSTLLLLVAAAIGDKWKGVYQYALEHAFRFLSYGDGNLLFMAGS